MFILGPAYVWILAVTLAQATRRDLQMALIQVLLGSLALLFVLLRLSMAEHKNDRTTIGKLMWITAALCIYLAYIGQMLPHAEFQFEWQNIFIIAMSSLAFVLISTSVAINFLDSTLLMLNGTISFVRRIAKR